MSALHGGSNPQGDSSLLGILLCEPDGREELVFIVGHLGPELRLRLIQGDACEVGQFGPNRQLELPLGIQLAARHPLQVFQAQFFFVYYGSRPS